MIAAAATPRIERLVDQAAARARADAALAARGGLMPYLRLHYRPCSEHEDGAVELLSEGDPVPDGFVTTNEVLKPSVPYSSFYQWIRERVGKLPLLAPGIKTI